MAPAGSASGNSRSRRRPAAARRVVRGVHRARPPGTGQHAARSKRDIDLKAGAGKVARDAVTGDNITANKDITSNQKMMDLVKSLESGNVLGWFGRFDALDQPGASSWRAGRPSCPRSRGSRPAVVWTGGLGGVLQAETNDDESAANLPRRDARSAGPWRRCRPGPDLRCWRWFNRSSLAEPAKTVTLGVRRAGRSPSISWALPSIAVGKISRP